MLVFVQRYITKLVDNTSVTRINKKDKKKVRQIMTLLKYVTT